MRGGVERELEQSNECGWRKFKKGKEAFGSPQAGYAKESWIEREREAAEKGFGSSELRRTHEKGKREWLRVRREGRKVEGS